MKPTRDGYGDGIVEAAAENKNIIVLDADLGKSTRGSWFKQKYPHRHINVGISEQDMMNIAAGLAHEGKIPFAATFAIFTERAFEQIRNGVCRPNLNVKVVGSHAGMLTGKDGSSAQCVEDISVYRTLPNMVVVSPADYYEAKSATKLLATHSGPAYLRLGRDAQPFIYDETYQFRLGKANLLRDGTDITIIATGPLVSFALEAAKQLQEDSINARVINMSTIKPIDQDIIVKAAKETGAIVTCEDHLVTGGLGSAVAEVLSEHSPVWLERVGMNDRFGESGNPQELYEKYGLDAKGIVAAARRVITKKLG